MFLDLEILYSFPLMVAISLLSSKAATTPPSKVSSGLVTLYASSPVASGAGSLVVKFFMLSSKTYTYLMDEIRPYLLNPSFTTSPAVGIEPVATSGVVLHQNSSPSIRYNIDHMLSPFSLEL